jgi:hypothetical protein
MLGETNLKTFCRLVVSGPNCDKIYLSLYVELNILLLIALISKFNIMLKYKFIKAFILFIKTNC